MQTVPDMDGTEVIIETTANGFNDFYKLWRKAEAGESEFVPIFLPWTVAPEYRAKVPADFEMTSAEKRLVELHGLDLEQVAWRRSEDLAARRRGAVRAGISARSIRGLHRLQV